MEGKDNMEMQLWEYIDGICDPKEHARIAQLVSVDVEWKEKYDELLAFNAGILKSLDMEQPSVRFTKNVMDEVTGAKIAPAINTYINPLVIKSIAAFFLLSIVSILGYMVYSIDWSAMDTTAVIPKISLPHFHISNYVSTNALYAILAANVILGLLFADTMLRKMNSRKQHH